MRPEAYLPDLAGSLNNMSNYLAKSGQFDSALAASEEAVAHYRTLAQALPDRFLPDLARALNNLSVHLSTLGRHEDAPEPPARRPMLTSQRRLDKA